MEKVVLDIGELATLNITAIGGDLRLTGREGGMLEVQAPDHGQLTVEEKDGAYRLNCRSGCLVFLPESTRVEAENVGGDARLTDIKSGVMVRSVGGDIALRRVGPSAFELIGGDMQVKGVDGDLSVDVLGGDAVIQDVSGALRMRSIGGDLVLDGAHGGFDCSAGGDISSTIRADAAGPMKLNAGGDLACRLLDGVSARVQLNAGGDLHLPSGFVRGESGEIEVGGGSEQVELTAGGDLSLRVGTHPRGVPDDFVGDILTEVDAKLAEMEARFSALGAGLDSFDADRIGERVRRAVRRAQRKAEKAERKAQKFQGGYTGDLRMPSTMGIGSRFDTGGEHSEATDAERLAILKMVEEGKITVEEAENLFQALEGEL